MAQAFQLNKDKKTIRVDGVNHTVKYGMIYDVKLLLPQVKVIVEQAIFKNLILFKR